MEIFAHLYTFLHPLMWVFFLLKMCKMDTFFFILEDYTRPDVVALISELIKQLKTYFHNTFSHTCIFTILKQRY